MSAAPSSIFSTTSDRRYAAGADLTIDTRIDPSFPRDAVEARLGWERLEFAGGGTGRWRADLRGYLGMVGSTVLAVRGQVVRADSSVPRSEHSLLGDQANLRGYPVGFQAGDRLASASAEVRFPLNSPLSAGRLGFTLFADVGTTWMAGERLTKQRFSKGAGGGLYVGAAAFVLDASLAWPEEGRPRLHVGFGMDF
jgi:hemolysin activation/secretion protein